MNEIPIENNRKRVSGSKVFCPPIFTETLTPQHLDVYDKLFKITWHAKLRRRIRITFKWKIIRSILHMIRFMKKNHSKPK